MNQAVSPLLTDLYELTMIGGYYRHGRHEMEVCFEYFFRDLPGECGFGLFAGLEDLAARVESLRFGKREIEFLRSLALFPEEFLEALSAFRFRGDMDALPEGTVVFPHEPLVRVHGALWEAQFLETLLLNSLNYPTLVASKAARICLTARPDPVLEFGLRRAQGPDGGVTGSRAAYIGGCAGTSNVEAGRRFGIPVKGTHAHSWVMSYASELEAFRAYLEAFPEAPTLLVDTYDTLKSGVPNAITSFLELRSKGWTGRPSIRIDSGDLATDSIAAHEMFGRAGMPDPLIVASNELDEDLIADLKRQGAKINAWGVGTNLITASDDPALNGIYKLAAVKRKGKWESKIKISGNPNKTTDPGIKHAVRYRRKGRMVADILYSADEIPPMNGPVRGVNRTLLYKKRQWDAGVRGRMMLEPLMREGKIVTPLPGLAEIRERAQEEIACMPDKILRLRNPDIYPVVLSESLARVKASELKKHFRKTGKENDHHLD